MTSKTQKIIRYPIFALTFRNWIQNNNLTQTELSKKLQISQSLVSRFCTGERLPSLPVFLRLINLLKNDQRAQFIKILNTQLRADKCKNYLITQ